MDSCNSNGSLQSSSNGEEEFDSQAQSISAIFNPSSAFLHDHPITQLPSSSHQHHQHTRPSSSSFLDSLSSYLDAFPRSPPPDTNPLNPGSSWTYRALSPSSQPTCTDDALMLRTTSMPNDPPPDLHVYSGCAPPQSQTPAGGGRGSKKRSRASRRAPTTVITTDTSNFRAMVQEFTGIPTPPFSSPSLPFSRPRLDLLHNAAMPPYLPRPFAQKVQAQIPAPLSMLDGSIPSIIATSRSTNESTCITSTTATTSSDQHQQVFAFQSLLQTPLLNPRCSSPIMAAFGERVQAPAVSTVAVDYATGNLGHAAGSAGMHSGREDHGGVRAQVMRPLFTTSTSAAGGDGTADDSWIFPPE